MADKTLQLIIQMQAQDAIRQLSSMSDEIKTLSSALGDNSGVSEELAGTFSALEDSAGRLRAEIQLFGKADESVARQQQLTKEAMIEMVSKGMDPQSEAVQKLKQQYDQLGTSTKKSEGFFSSMAGQFLTGQAAFTLATKALRGFVDLMKESAELYRQQEKVEQELSAAVAMNPMYQPGTAKRLRDFASALQKVTTQGDETTMELMKTLVATGRTEEEVKKIIQTAADLDAAGIMSYDSAVQALNMSFSGFSGTLRRQFKELKDLDEAEFASGRAVDILSEKVKGYAEMAASTGAGSVKQFKNALGDLKEELGAGWEQVFAPQRNELTKTIQKWTELLREAREYEKYKKLNADENTKTLESLQGQRDQELRILKRYEDAYGKGNDPVGKSLIDSQLAKIKVLNEQISSLLDEEELAAEEAALARAEADRIRKEGEDALKAQKEREDWLDGLYSQTEEAKLRAKEEEFNRVLGELDKAEKGSDEFNKLMRVKDMLALELIDLRKMGGSALVEIDKATGRTITDINKEIVDNQKKLEETKRQIEDIILQSYAGTDDGRLKTAENNLRLVQSELDKSTDYTSDRYKGLLALQEKYTSEVLELRKMGGSVLQLVDKTTGKTFEQLNKEMAEETSQLKRAQERFDSWFKNLYSQTAEGKAEALETEYQKVLNALDASEFGSEEYRQWMAIKNMMAEDIMELRNMGGSALQKVSADAGPTYARTYKQVMAGMTSYSEVFNQKLYEGLRNISDMSEETAAVVTNMLGKIADEGFTQVIQGAKEFGKAMEDGKLSASEFKDILAQQAEAILDILPTLFLQAGLQLIANGQWALGLGFVAASATTAVTSGFVSAKTGGTSRSARGNVFEDGQMVRFARGGVATSPQHFMLGDGRTAEWAENGPEAIMPLKRLSDGTLGVHAEGGGETKVNIVINNLTGEVVETKETTGADGSRELEITIGKYLKQAASDGTLDSPLSSRYGIRPKGVR